MFALSVVWWWWALYTIYKVTDILGKTSKKVETVVDEVDHIKKDIKQIKK